MKIRFKKKSEALKANATGDFSKSEKFGSKGWKKARYEVAYIKL